MLLAFMHRTSPTRMQVHLGKGHFGSVSQAMWDDGTGMTHEVAVKSLTNGSSRNERVKLLQEAAIMSQFHHTNVLRLYGVVVKSDEVSK